MTLRLAAGQERAAAEFLRAELDPANWLLLAGLAAEIVAIHESASNGGTHVLVVPASALEETKLAGLARKSRAAGPIL